MADEELEEEAGEEEGKKSGGAGNKIIMIIAGVVLVFLLIVGGVIAMLLSGGEGDMADDPAMADKAAMTTGGGGGGGKPAMAANRGTNHITVGPIHELDKFVVNLITKRGKRYLRVKISLELDSENVLAELEMKKVVLSDTIIDILTARTKQELSTSKGKNRLKDELVTRINSSLIDGFVKNVFFTEFIIQ